MTRISSSLGHQIEVQMHSTKEMEKNILRIILIFINFINTYINSCKISPTFMSNNEFTMYGKVR